MLRRDQYASIASSLSRRASAGAMPREIFDPSSPVQIDCAASMTARSCAGSLAFAATHNTRAISDCACAAIRGTTCRSARRASLVNTWSRSMASDWIGGSGIPCMGGAAKGEGIFAGSATTPGASRCGCTGAGIASGGGGGFVIFACAIDGCGSNCANCRVLDGVGGASVAGFLGDAACSRRSSMGAAFLPTSCNNRENQPASATREERARSRVGDSGGAVGVSAICVDAVCSCRSVAAFDGASTDAAGGAACVGVGAGSARASACDCPGAPCATEVGKMPCALNGTRLSEGTATARCAPLLNVAVFDGCAARGGADFAMAFLPFVLAVLFAGSALLDTTGADADGVDATCGRLAGGAIVSGGF